MKEAMGYTPAAAQGQRDAISCQVDLRDVLARMSAPIVTVTELRDVSETSRNHLSCNCGTL